MISIAASPAEKRRPMPGDRIVPDPAMAFTHAITINAPLQKVWPWLAQMGSLRGDWYSYDWIDNGGRPSADRVLEEYQHVAPGDVLPWMPGAKDGFIVAAVDPPRDLILIVPGPRGPIVSWEHLLEPVPTNRSRLIVRGRVGRDWKQMARAAQTPGRHKAFIEYVYQVLGHLPTVLLILIGGLGHRWMEARHVRGIKECAERDDAGV